MKNSIIKIGNQALAIFAILIIVISALSSFLGQEAAQYSTLFALGGNGLSINTIWELGLFSLVVSLLRSLMYSNRIFKNITMTMRTVMILVIMIVAATVFVILFGWFSLNDAKAWVSYAVSLLLSIAASTVISAISENKINKEMQIALEQLQEEE